MDLNMGNFDGDIVCEVGVVVELIVEGVLVGFGEVNIEENC
ncbi:hypothetical protein [Siminovitchia fortis]|nr:hypothetical protein [Siminovitchia fortis]